MADSLNEPPKKKCVSAQLNRLKREKAPRLLLRRWVSIEVKYINGLNCIVKGVLRRKERKAKGAKPKLNDQQIRKLYKIIISKNPTQLKFEFALWTRAMIREVIRNEFRVKLSDVSVGRLLHKLGLSPQKPLRRAYQRDEEKVKEWQEIAYPEIRKRAKKMKATLYFGDEANVRSDYHSGTTWAPIGKTPVVKTTGARFSVNMISAVSSRGKLRFMAFEGKMNGDKFIEFLKRLIYRAPRPTFLILDGHPVHKSKKVKEFVATTKGKLRLFIGLSSLVKTMHFSARL